MNDHSRHGTRSTLTTDGALAASTAFSSRSWVIVLLLALASATASAVATESNAAPKSTKRQTPWASSKVAGMPDPPLPYDFEVAFPKLKFQRPLALTDAPGSDRLFVVENHGLVFSFPADPSVERPDLFLDVKALFPNLASVYGLTFHPDFESNRTFFICYVLSGTDPDGSRVARMRATSDDPPRAIAETHEVVYSWLAGGHNGGCLKFGPDGYLYITTGDGTGPNPPDRHRVGQDVSNVLSSILRIDVDRRATGLKYAIPPDNPFLHLPQARPEIFAFGFRNPWKMSFDRLTGELWVGDVGWEMWELVYRVEKGDNYGWSVVEGPQPVHPEDPVGPAPIVPPVVAHDHYESRSITGGFVYRGERLKDLAGAYVYGDFSTGKMWGLRYDGERVTSLVELVNTPLQIVAYGEDHHGELYFVDYERTGRIYRLKRNDTPDRSAEFPRLLSQTGLFESTRDLKPASGVVPYEVNSPLWQDGTVAQRLLAIPGEAQIDASSQRWTFPEGTVIARTVFTRGALEASAERVTADTLATTTVKALATSAAPVAAAVPAGASASRRLETQILHLESAEWRPYTYIWNDAGSDAELAPAEGLQRDPTARRESDANTQSRANGWRIASRAECSVCHTDKLGSVLGVDEIQLDRDVSHDGRRENQLQRLERLGLLASRRQRPKEYAAMVDPFDAAAGLTARARSYLHSNCYHCHRPGGGGTSMIHLNYRLPLEQTLTIGARPSQGDFGLEAPAVIAAGDPYASVLFYRMSKHGRGRMPHAGATEIDQRGVDLIHDWIVSLGDVTAARDEAQATEQFAAQIANQVRSRSNGNKAPENSPPRAWSPRRALALSHALASQTRIGGQSMVATARRQLIAAGSQADDINVRELFERFLPPERRTKRLGPQIDPKEVLSRRGNVTRGRHAFFFGVASQCRSCHSIQRKGGSVGPDLSQIGKKYTREKILETLLSPSLEIEEKYRSYALVTTNGEVVAGILIDNSDRAVVIKTADGKEIRRSHGDIASLSMQEQSLMPEGLLREFTAQDAADLVDYLASLK